MKKPNSRKIMLEAITHVVVITMILATFIGGFFIIKSWDKIMPMKNPFVSEQEFSVEPDPETEEPTQPELPVENTSNINVEGNLTESNAVEADGKTSEDVEAQPKEIETDNETNKQDSAYNEETAQLIVAIATEQLGTPFKSGGDSPDEGFDSTGFTYYCANEAGVKFPRNLKDQLKSGEWVTFNELKAGDIVYFSQEVGGNATFCGVYVGGGLIIYSPVPDDFVKTANITTNYWTTHFVTGLRLTSQTNE